MKELTVGEYCKIHNVTRQGVYQKIKMGVIKHNKINGVMVVYIDRNNNLIKVKNNLHDNLHDNLQENTVIEQIPKCYKELEKLQVTIQVLLKEKEELYERIIENEKLQKKEILLVQKNKDEQLKMYMELIKKQSDNLIGSGQYAKKTEDDVEIIEVDVEKKIMKNNKFVKIMKNKGYGNNDINKIIAKRLKKKDSRFKLKDDKLIIYKDKFEDL